MSETYYPMDHTVDEWKAMAGRNNREKADSFERSDTDGFMSQWASGVMANVYLACARHAENGGVATIPWVFTADGKPVDRWKWTETRYGQSVLVYGEEYGSNKFWNPSEHRKGAERLKRDNAKGFHWGTVETEVVVELVGASALAVRPVTKHRKGAEVKPVDVVSERHYEDRT